MKLWESRKKNQEGEELKELFQKETLQEEESSEEPYSDNGAPKKRKSRSPVSESCRKRNKGCGKTHRAFCEKAQNSDRADCPDSDSGHRGAGCLAEQEPQASDAADHDSGDSHCREDGFDKFHRCDGHACHGRRKVRNYDTGKY